MRIDQPKPYNIHAYDIDCIGKNKSIKLVILVMEKKALQH